MFTILEDTKVKATFVKITSTEDIQDKALHCYPNPAKDIATIEGLRAYQEVKVYTINGALLLTEKADLNGKVNLNTVSFADGIYIIKIGRKALKLEIKH